MTIKVHRNAKLTPEDVKLIRSMGKNYPHREIARKFAVGPTTIRDILTNKTWRMKDAQETT